MYRSVLNCRLRVQRCCRPCATLLSVTLCVVCGPHNRGRLDHGLDFGLLSGGVCTHAFARQSTQYTRTLNRLGALGALGVQYAAESPGLLH